MESILHHLWNGNIDPVLQIDPESERLDELDQRISDEQDWWRERLSKEDYERLDNLLFLIKYNVNDIFSEEHFKYGFRLASMIFVDLLTNPLPIKSAQTPQT